MKRIKIILETVMLCLLILIAFGLGLVSGINITDTNENLIN